MTLDRRQFLLRSGLLAAFGPTLLAACGDDGSSSGGNDTLRIATWPFYIEDDQNPSKAPTIKKFVARTGIDVVYKTEVDANDTFTAKYSPDLEKGNGIGYDIVVLTSWMASRWIKNGWTQALDDTKIPNKGNLIDRMQNPPWDPGRTHSLPGMIGQVGIAYYPDKTGFEITSTKDLLDPRLKGRVTILSELRDCLGLFILANGVNPEDVTVAQAKEAIDQIAQARDKGQFRKITGNSYIEDLGLGDVHAAVAWSGDVASLQADNPGLRWVVPKEGAMSFVDTMIVPTGGNLGPAQQWMDYLYDPAVSGPLFEAISYTSPVKGAADHMSAKAASNPLINPPADAKIHDFRDLSEDEAEELETAFAKATQQ
jgi:spermidine/putrescine transport system substrate-binding protein